MPHMKFMLPEAFAPLRASALFTLCCIGALLLGCGTSEPEGTSEESPAAAAPAPAGAPHVLLISIDTLRADRLGSYGAEREDITPHLDTLAAEGLRFAEARAPAPWTLPSHATMLTGVHAYDLGMRHKSSALPEEAETVAETFAAAGYRTAAFVDSGKGGYVGAQRGFDRGFETFRHAPFVKPPEWTKYDMAKTADEAIQWLEEDGRGEDEPFFLFLHTKAVHALPPNTPCLDEHCFPYDKPEPWRFAYLDPTDATRQWEEEERGQGQQYLWSLNANFLDGTLDPRAFPAGDVAVLSELYDEGLRYTDHHLGRVFETLRTLDLWNDTVIVVTSDHGEAFLEHQLLMHQEVYRDLVRVPLLIKAAADTSDGTTTPQVIDIPVELADVAPTLTALAGIAPIPTATGHPLPPAPGVGPPAPQEHFSYYLFPPTFTYRAFRLERDGHALVSHNGPGAAEPGELYDLRADPAEQAPLTGTEADALRQTLAQALRQRLGQPPLFEPRLIEEDEEALRELKTLGYID